MYSSNSFARRAFLLGASYVGARALGLFSFAKAEAAISGASAMVSFTFDDAYPDPISSGVIAELEKAGYRGTFYVPTVRINLSGYMTLAALESLAARGHEITAHSRSHKDLTVMTTSQIAAEVVGSRDDLRAQGFWPTTFAVPHGKSNAEVESIIRSAGFISSRGTDTAINYRDSNQWKLYADSIKVGTESWARIKSWIDSALNTRGWYIMLFHKFDRVGDSYSIPSAIVKQQIVPYLKDRGVAVVTMREGTCRFFACA